MPVGLDFLCIGCQKAGTQWLYDQLDSHPDFRMPPIKELHYLDTRFAKSGIARMARFLPDRAERVRRRLERKRSGRVADCDIAFIRGAKALLKQPLDIPRYAELFDHFGEKLTGDVTPFYGSIKKATIAEVRSALPHLKIVLLVRDPVDRVWSQLSMQYRRNPGLLPRLNDPDAVLKHVTKKHYSMRSYPSRIWTRWTRIFPRDQIAFFFFDDIRARPEDVRRDIVKFLGGDPDIRGAVAPEYNRKAGNVKVPISPEVEQALIERFADEFRSSARTFGGHAVEWARRRGVVA